MIDKAFWQEVNKAWTRESKTSFIYKSGKSSEFAPELKAFGGMFDEVETDGDFELDFGSGGTAGGFGAGGFGTSGYGAGDGSFSVGGTGFGGAGVAGRESVEVKPRLDNEQFMAIIEKRNLPSFAEACDMLIACKLPAKMEDVYNNLSDEMRTLQEAITKFTDIYKTDMTEFYEYYIPETLELASAYLEYVNAKVDPAVISETEDELMQSSEKLLIALQDKKSELYKFGSMELKARAQALDSLMSQDGHVSPEFRL